MNQQTLVFPSVLTLEEVANYLKLSQETVVQLAQNGKIPGRKVEHQWRFLRVAVDEWLKGQDKITVPESSSLEIDPDNSLVKDVKQLSLSDKIKLLRLLAEELDTTQDIYPFEPYKTYHLPTPYNMFGVGEALMKAMESEEDAL